MRLKWGGEKHRRGSGFVLCPASQGKPKGGGEQGPVWRWPWPESHPRETQTRKRSSGISQRQGPASDPLGQSGVCAGDPAWRGRGRARGAAAEATRSLHSRCPVEGLQGAPWSPRRASSLQGIWQLFTLLRKEQGYDLEFIIYVADFTMFHVLSCFLPLQFHSSLWGH